MVPFGRLLKALDRLQPEDIAVFSKRFFNSIFVEMLIAGNVELEQAKVCSSCVCDEELASQGFRSTFRARLSASRGRLIPLFLLTDDWQKTPGHY